MFFFIFPLAAQAAVDDLTGSYGKIGSEDVYWGSGLSTDTFPVTGYAGTTLTLTKIPALDANTYSKIKGAFYVDADLTTNDHGSTGEEGSLASILATIAALGSTFAVVVVPPSDTVYQFDTDLAVGSTIHLIIRPGAVLKPLTGNTLTLNCRLTVDPMCQAFDASVGTITGSPVIDYVTPQNFGASAEAAIDDANDDDGPAIQNAMDFWDKVIFPPGYYYIETTIEANDNQWLEGYGAVLYPKLNYPDNPAYGVYPTRVLTNEDHINGNSNITVKGLTFNGNSDARTRSPVANNTDSDNLIRFEDVTGLRIHDVRMTHYVSNYSALAADADSNVPHSVLAIDDSSKIELLGVKLYDSRMEGIYITDSTDITVHNYQSWETAAWQAAESSGLWTPLGIFWCDKVVISGCNIKRRSNAKTGSVANLSISNAVVTGNFSEYGAGWDFGNEGAVKAWEGTDIVFSGNNVTGSAPVYFSPPYSGDVFRRITVAGNTLKVTADTASGDSFAYGIRVDAAEDVVIKGNNISHVTGGTAEWIGITVNGTQNRITIADNNIYDANTCIRFTTDTTFRAVNIVDNVLVAADIDDDETGSGDSVCVYFYMHSSYTSLSYDEVNITGNQMYAVGAWLMARDQSTPSPGGSRLRFIGNTCRTDTVMVADYGVRLYDWEYVDISHNFMEKPDSHQIQNTANLTMIGNQMEDIHGGSGTTGYIVSGSSGVLTFIGNTLIDATGGVNHFYSNPAIVVTDFNMEHNYPATSTGIS